MLTLSTCVLFVLCLFVILVDSHCGFECRALVMIVSVSKHCNFFSYGLTLFAIIFFHIFNK